VTLTDSSRPNRKSDVIAILGLANFEYDSVFFVPIESLHSGLQRSNVPG
jgi:hypothetical protein